MTNDRKLSDDVSIRSLDSPDLGSLDDSQSSASASSTGATTEAAGAASDVGDAVDEIPVPPAMSPAEIDERAQVVEALRGDQSGVAESAERATESASDRSMGRGDEATPPG